MKNTMDFNNKTMQAATITVMNDILASDAEGKSMDDLYATLCKYVKVSKAQFEEYYDQAKVTVDTWKNGNLSGELSDEDLDMVVGGSLGSFFGEIGNGLVKAASAVGNFVKEHAVEIAVVAGILLFCTGVGIAAGGMLSICALAESAFVAGATAAASTGAMVAGGVVGAALGGVAAYSVYN